METRKERRDGHLRGCACVPSPSICAHVVEAPCQLWDAQRSSPGPEDTAHRAQRVMCREHSSTPSAHASISRPTFTELGTEYVLARACFPGEPKQPSRGCQNRPHLPPSPSPRNVRLAQAGASSPGLSQPHRRGSGAVGGSAGRGPPLLPLHWRCQEQHIHTCRSAISLLPSFRCPNPSRRGQTPAPHHPTSSFSGAAERPGGSLDRSAHREIKLAAKSSSPRETLNFLVSFLL